MENPTNNFKLLVCGIETVILFGAIIFVVNLFLWRLHIESDFVQLQIFGIPEWLDDILRQIPVDLGHIKAQLRHLGNDH